MYESWPAPLSKGGTSEEMALVMRASGPHVLLILAPLFDEANKMRLLLAGAARQLAEKGITSIIPDLPGSNESLASQSQQTLSGWKAAAKAAADHFEVTHVLAVRTASSLAPASLPGWLYAPVPANHALRTMARAQSLTDSETGNSRKAAHIMDEAAMKGGLIAGWDLGATMVRELQAESSAGPATYRTIDHVDIGGRPAWLSADLGDDPVQAAALASLIADALAKA